MSSILTGIKRDAFNVLTLMNIIMFFSSMPDIQETVIKKLKEIKGRKDLEAIVVREKEHLSYIIISLEPEMYSIYIKTLDRIVFKRSFRDTEKDIFLKHLFCGNHISWMPRDIFEKMEEKHPELLYDKCMIVKIQKLICLKDKVQEFSCFKLLKCANESVSASLCERKRKTPILYPALENSESLKPLRKFRIFDTQSSAVKSTEQKLRTEDADLEKYIDIFDRYFSPEACKAKYENSKTKYESSCVSSWDDMDATDKFTKDHTTIPSMNLETTATSEMQSSEESVLNSCVSSWDDMDASDEFTKDHTAIPSMNLETTATSEMQASEESVLPESLFNFHPLKSESFVSLREIMKLGDSKEKKVKVFLSFEEQFSFLNLDPAKNEKSSTSEEFLS